MIFQSLPFLLHLLYFNFKCKMFNRNMCHKIYIHVVLIKLNRWKFESSKMDNFSATYGIFNFQFGVIIQFAIFLFF